MELKVVPEETSEAWLTLRDPEGWMDVGVKFDGCVHLRKYYNRPRHLQTDEDDQDYIHICDIDDMIETLQKIKKAATEHFEEWRQFWP
jgi:hypothetical protein